MLSLRLRASEQSFTNFYKIAERRITQGWVVGWQIMWHESPAPLRIWCYSSSRECEKPFSFYSSLSQHINKYWTRVSRFVLHFTYNMAICGLSYSKQTQEALKASKKKVFQLDTINPHWINKRYLFNL